MKEKLQNQLKELAVAIVNTNDFSVQELKEKAQQLYEQAILLAYAEKKEATEKTVFVEEKKQIEPEQKNEVEVIEKPIEEEKVTQIPEEKSIEELPTFDIEEGVLGMTFEPSEPSGYTQKIAHQETEEEVVEIKEAPKKAPALLHELENLTKDFDLPDFEPAKAPENVVPTTVQPLETISKPKKSLNDSLNKGFQIGLNDRLAFVNQLFGGNQQDFTRVVSQLNTIDTLSEAQQFINEIVKPEYNNWEGKEAFELRFLDLVERNFQE